MILKIISKRGFFAFLLCLFISYSCSTQQKSYFITETKSSEYEINTDYGTDSSIITLIRPYKDSLDHILNRIIGHTATPMVKGFPEGLLGNLVADLIANKFITDSLSKNAFVLINNGGLRSELPAGNITVRNIYEVMPFDNEVVILKLNPETVSKLMGHILKGEEVAISGCKFIIHKKTKAELLFNDIPYSTDKQYFLITSDYLANGGSSMFFLQEAVARYDTHIRIRDLMIEGIESLYSQNITLKSKIDGRIRLVE